MVAQNNIFKAPVLPQNPAAAERHSYSYLDQIDWASEMALMKNDISGSIRDQLAFPTNIIIHPGNCQAVNI